MFKLRVENMSEVLGKLKGQVPSELLEKVSQNNEDWTQDLTPSELSKLALELDTLNKEDQVNIDIIPDTKDIRTQMGMDFNYKINPIMKKVFVKYLSSIIKTASNIGKKRRALLYIEKYESEFGKSLMFFSNDQIEKYLIEQYGGSHYAMLDAVKTYDSFFDFYVLSSDEKTDGNPWKKYSNLNAVSELARKVEKPVLDREKIINFFSLSDNAQIGVLPALLFEGVRRDELTSLKLDGVLDNGIYIKALNNEEHNGFRLHTDRFIDIDEDVQQIIKQTAKTEIIASRIKEKTGIEWGRDLVLAKGDYLLRKPEAVDAEDPIENPQLTSEGLRTRTTAMTTRLLEMYPKLGRLTAQKIENYGKAYYINKFMEEENLSEREAIIKTLKRFGEWRTNGNDKEERAEYANASAIRRLRARYKTYLQ